MDYTAIDEAMVPFSEYLQQLAAFEHGRVSDETKSVMMRIESVAVETPFELDLQWDADGKLVLGAAPPLYYVATTVEPVFHHMKICITEDKK